MKLPIQAKPIMRKVSTVRISAVYGITPSERCSSQDDCPDGKRCTANGYCRRVGEP